MDVRHRHCKKGKAFAGPSERRRRSLSKPMSSALLTSRPVPLESSSDVGSSDSNDNSSTDQYAFFETRYRPGTGDDKGKGKAP